MLNFLFWNVHKSDLSEVAAELVVENRIDVVALSECQHSEEFAKAIRTATGHRFWASVSPVRDIAIISRLPRRNVKAVRDSLYVSFREIKPLIAKPVLLAVVHLPSKLWMSDADQAQHCVEVIRDIRSQEERRGHSRTVILGDFNMNPFEQGVVSAAGLHAISSRSVVARGNRTVRGTSYEFLYNPMWKFFGQNAGGGYGTYYNAKGDFIDYFWHVFDQVLLRPDLLDVFNDDDLRVLTRAGDIPLLRDGVPDSSISDHLPIMFSLQID